MGSADIIFDLVSTGVTLRENNLKEISGGTVMQSQGILVANKKALMERPGLLQVRGEELRTVTPWHVSVVRRGHQDLTVWSCCLISLILVHQHRFPALAQAMLGV